MSVFSILAQTLCFSSIAGAVVYTVKVAPAVWREAKTDKRYALEILYGGMLVGAITGFQMMLTAPLLIPQEIAYQRGYMKRTFNIAMVNYIAQGENTNFGMDYATKLNPVQKKQSETKE